MRSSTWDPQGILKHRKQETHFRPQRVFSFTGRLLRREPSVIYNKIQTVQRAWGKKGHRARHYQIVGFIDLALIHFYNEVTTNLFPATTGARGVRQRNTVTQKLMSGLTQNTGASRITNLNHGQKDSWGMKELALHADNFDLALLGKATPLPQIR